MPRLSRRFIKQIKAPQKGQVFYRDDKLPGFALRVTPGCKSYVVECRVNGVNCRVTIGKDGLWTPEAARAKALQLLAEMSKGSCPKKKGVSRVTLAEVLDRYLATRHLRPNTIRNYTQILNRCLGDWLNKPVTAITKDMIEIRHRELTRTTKQGTPGKIQANMAMRILGAMLKFAADNYETNDGTPLLTLNPVQRLSQNKTWHRESRRQTIIPDAKLPIWYQTICNLRHETVRDYLLCLLFTGLRRNEAATLKWTDVDLELKMITIKAQFAKNHRQHCLPLSNFLMEVFYRRKALETPKSGYVFPGQGGRHHIIDSGHVIAGVVRKSGCKFTLHDLRRTYLTTAARLQIPYHMIKRLANHVTGNDVTLGYFIVDVEGLREATEMITNRFLELISVDN